jgi:hypothetical protein
LVIPRLASAFIVSLVFEFYKCIRFAPRARRKDFIFPLRVHLRNCRCFMRIFGQRSWETRNNIMVSAGILEFQKCVRSLLCMCSRTVRFVTSYTGSTLRQLSRQDSTSQSASLSDIQILTALEQHDITICPSVADAHQGSSRLEKVQGIPVREWCHLLGDKR